MLHGDIIRIVAENSDRTPDRRAVAAFLLMHRNSCPCGQEAVEGLLWDEIFAYLGEDLTQAIWDLPV